MEGRGRVQGCSIHSNPLRVRLICGFGGSVESESLHALMTFDGSLARCERHFVFTHARKGFTALKW